MPETILAIKIDVDTDRGTRLGVPELIALFDEFDVKATFLFSLGPDNTGRAVKRILRPGFFSKVRRTGVVGVYGIRTLLNGVLLPGPHVGRRNEGVMRHARDEGHEAGIHCYDHIRWQDNLGKMSREQISVEFGKARREFERIFHEPAKTAGAAGWQANAHSLAVYDESNLLYASDTRGTHPFYPRVDGVVYKTLQIPTTLPTLDELLGRPGHPEGHIVEYYLSLLRPDTPNVLTIHAELEGMKKLALFRDFVERAQARGVRIVKLNDLARTVVLHPEAIPICEMAPGAVDGRSGTVALQKCTR